ncbi:MAG: sigma-54-dependent Fis family transcriptional regulator [Candidatus Eisenbacteria bacterium]|nr:sigma-54-dependent Fis family transcriptional regulator [Candidatus Eisenbacteria bacterium]
MLAEKETRRKAAVLVIDDEAEIRQSLQKLLTREGYEVHAAADGKEAMSLVRTHRFPVALSDLRLPDVDGLDLLKMLKIASPETEVVMITGYGTVDDAVRAMKDGAYDFIQKPVKRHLILKSVEKALERRALASENRELRARIRSMERTTSPVSASPSMQKVIEMAEQVAPSAASVLIQGESGTGKEVIADIIHAASLRKDAPFIKVNCAAIPETLLEAELFGHEKGSFTGAVSRRIGRFELADGGTLFLDEIGEMSQATQVKLLRVLQEGEFERVGGAETLRVDVRILAATNADLEEAIRSRRFREDLYYRLNVVTIHIPPLRERPEDIPLLAERFMRAFNERNNKAIEGLSPEVIDRFLQYGWPGNVRELENVIERAVVLGKGRFVEPEDLPPSLHRREGVESAVRVPFGMTMAQAEHRIITETLRRTRGNKEMAARLLGIAARTIYRKLENPPPPFQAE